MINIRASGFKSVMLTTTARNHPVWRNQIVGYLVTTRTTFDPVFINPKPCLTDLLTKTPERPGHWRGQLVEQTIGYLEVTCLVSLERRVGKAVGLYKCRSWYVAREDDQFRANIYILISKLRYRHEQVFSIYVYSYGRVTDLQ